MAKGEANGKSSTLSYYKITIGYPDRLCGPPVNMNFRVFDPRGVTRINFTCQLIKFGPITVEIKLVIIKFPYNARFDWLKQRTLSENKEQVNDIKLAFKFLLRNFDKFDPN